MKNILSLSLAKGKKLLTEFREVRKEPEFMVLAMTDTISSTKFALPPIITFEVLMIAIWIYRLCVGMPLSVFYMMCYIFLLTFSVVCLVAIMRKSVDVTVHYRKIYSIQQLYVVAIVVWSLIVTYLDCTVGGQNMSVLVYITIMTVVPIFTFCSFYFWLALTAIVTAIIYWIAYLYRENFLSFVINFTVFATINVIANWSLYRIRCRGYLRQLNLMEISNERRRFAYVDEMTGLGNRRSFDEKVEALGKAELPSDLLVAMFDLNSLKQANDTKGHTAGDELIKGAADCIKKVFGAYGHIYRIGGDEFCGIFCMNKEQLEQAKIDLEKATNRWHGVYVATLSLSSGYAFLEDVSSKTLEAMKTKADDEMYHCKAQYYATHSRRGRRVSTDDSVQSNAADASANKANDESQSNPQQ